MNSKIAIFYASTAALGAFLLFLLEPMFARMILPLLGGAANVWITAVMFYQVTLLAGYGYAHASGVLAPRAQFLLHCLLSFAALVTLPIAIPAGWSPPAGVNPVFAQIGLMAAAIGAPFAILSATAPLVQRWFSLLRPKDDPYPLYAFSNVGSFAALIAYPAIVEPLFTLSQQQVLWSAGYGLLAAAMAALGYISSRAANAPSEKVQTGAAPAPSAATLLRWLALAAAPSSLMLSTTSFIATDIASIPLLWVIPLGAYLATFVIAFSTASAAAGALATRYYPILLVPLCVALAPVLGKSNMNPSVTLPLHLIAFFFAALMCHCELSRTKPDASKLTLFYFIVASGGALGGIFNSIVAPYIFSDVLEYPLGLALVCLAAPTAGARLSSRTFALAIGAGLCAGLAVRIPNASDAFDLLGALSYKLLLLAGAVLLFLIRRYPASLAMGVGAYLAAAILAPSNTSLIYAERNFYGVNRVRDMPQAGLRIMEHGTTVHGLMALDDAHRTTPLGYYHPTGGLAEATLAVGRAGKAPVIAVIGLGAGEMACNGESDWRYDFYEIDPAVVAIATDKSLFPFLDQCAARSRRILGDGRLSLRAAANGAYDEIMIDAFTSDAIPMHLLTREAISEFLQKLKPGGLLVLHLSNRYFNLAPIVAAAARDMGLAGAARLRDPAVVAGTELPIYGSLAVALARSPEALEPLFELGWRRLKPIAGVSAWTDDWSNLIAAFILPGEPARAAWESAPPARRADAN
jgi:spermidine synthase